MNPQDLMVKELARLSRIAYPDPAIGEWTAFALEARRAELVEKVLKEARASGVDNSETQIRTTFDLWWHQGGYKTWLKCGDRAPVAVEGRYK